MPRLILTLTPPPVTGDETRPGRAPAPLLAGADADEVGASAMGPRGNSHGSCANRRLADFGMCAAAGALMALWAPLSAYSMRSLTPYGSSLLFGAAVLATSATLLVPILTRFPPSGPPTTGAAYFRLAPREHMWGVLGGAVWAIGTTANLICGAHLGAALSYAIGQSAPMVATLWGLLLYREFAGATPCTSLLVGAQFVLFIGAVALIALSK